mmetsp:Transcript_33377/g.99398  ORF Transcript_33377/g.99398 Transcript_33377/m.99398 type:complete len:605 (+) Transcript_33377:954-2768(+)
MIVPPDPSQFLHPPDLARQIHRLDRRRIPRHARASHEGRHESVVLRRVGLLGQNQYLTRHFTVMRRDALPMPIPPAPRRGESQCVPVRSTHRLQRRREAQRRGLDSHDVHLLQYVDGTLRLTAGGQKPQHGAVAHGVRLQSDDAHLLPAVPPDRSGLGLDGYGGRGGRHHLPTRREEGGVRREGGLNPLAGHVVERVGGATKVPRAGMEMDQYGMSVGTGPGGIGEQFLPLLVRRGGRRQGILEHTHRPPSLGGRGAARYERGIRLFPPGVHGYLGYSAGAVVLVVQQELQGAGQSDRLSAVRLGVLIAVRTQQGGDFGVGGERGGNGRLHQHRPVNPIPAALRGRHAIVPSIHLPPDGVRPSLELVSDPMRLGGRSGRQRARIPRQIVDHGVPHVVFQFLGRHGRVDRRQSPFDPPGLFDLLVPPTIHILAPFPRLGPRRTLLQDRVVMILTTFTIVRQALLSGGRARFRQSAMAALSGHGRRGGDVVRSALVEAEGRQARLRWIATEMAMATRMVVPDAAVPCARRRRERSSTGGKAAVRSSAVAAAAAGAAIIVAVPVVRGAGRKRGASRGAHRIETAAAQRGAAAATGISRASARQNGRP